MDTWQAIYEAYSTSDFCGKAIVIVLIALSAAVWSMIVNCLLTNRQFGCRSQHFKSRYDSLGASKLRIAREVERIEDDNPVAALCRDGVQDLQSVLAIDETQRLDMTARGLLPRPLSDAEIDRIQTTMSNSMAGRLQELQQPLTWIGSIASVAPMLGLFGTVWGVMMTFIGIVAAGGRPDIKAIAPGISGALLTTVAGLLVAIPALLMNNFILLSIQRIEAQMDSFTTDFVAMLKICRVQSPSAPARTQPAPSGSAAVNAGSEAHTPAEDA